MERRLRPADLLPGDQATVLHDTRVVRLAAVASFTIAEPSTKCRETRWT